MNKRILHEIYCLFEVDFAIKTAENAVMNHLIPALLDSFLNDVADNKPKKEVVESK